MLYKAFFNLYDGEIVAEIQKVTMSSGGSDESREIESIVLKISCEGRASAQSGTNYIVFVLIFVINTIILLRNILLQVLPMVVWLLQLLCRLSSFVTPTFSTLDRLLLIHEKKSKQLQLLLLLTSSKVRLQ